LFYIPRTRSGCTVCSIPNISRPSPKESSHAPFSRSHRQPCSISGSSTTRRMKIRETPWAPRTSLSGRSTRLNGRMMPGRWRNALRKARPLTIRSGLLEHCRSGPRRRFSRPGSRFTTTSAVRRKPSRPGCTGFSRVPARRSSSGQAFNRDTAACETSRVYP
jgi:hypothetical protein